MTHDEEFLLREKYSGKKTEEFFRDCARLDKGEPLAYIIGTIPFLGTTIHLDSHPLIPRTETEYWVSEVIAEMKASPIKKLRVLDLCAGSGCIGVATLKHVPGVFVEFVEIDEKHHPTILKNIEENGLDRSCTNILGGDLFSEVRGSYDYILSNPPYIDPELDRATASVRDYEPKDALYGGLGGTELILRIIRESYTFVRDVGTLYIEHEPEQSETIRLIGKESGFTVRTHSDQFKNERYTQLVRKA